MNEAGIPARIRSACREVARTARFVRIDPGAMDALEEELRESRSPAPDPAHHRRANDAETLAFVVTLDAVNFGSGWFPVLRKRPGCSGYLTVAGALSEHFDVHGSWSARELRALDAGRLARILGQDPDGEAMELMQLYARALGDLGRFLEDDYQGRFEGPIEAAAGRAWDLVELLARMPFYRDVARLDGREVPFFKRAQITAADLHLAFGGRGPGAFSDLSELTLFADNLVPHVLRLAGVLVYEPGLLRRIETGELLAPGSREEVEIRACALHAVELMVARVRDRWPGASAWLLDERLWLHGQRSESKQHPRHRCRTVYY